MNLADYRLVDLTHVIEPDQEPRPVHLELVPAPHATPDNDWYVMHRVEMFLNHVGTHIETPYHVLRDGKDAATVPLESLCGEGVVLDLCFTAPGGVVSEADVRKAAERAGGVRPGDIVLGWFDFDGTPANSRSFEAEAIAYLVEAGMKMMGVDLGGIELPDSDPRAASQYNHHQLLDRGICLIEQVANLGHMRQSRALIFALPVPISGLDSFPIRLIALERT